MSRCGERGEARRALHDIWPASQLRLSNWEAGVNDGAERAGRATDSNWESSRDRCRSVRRASAGERTAVMGVWYKGDGVQAQTGLPYLAHLLYVQVLLHRLCTLAPLPPPGLWASHFLPRNRLQRRPCLWCQQPGPAAAAPGLTCFARRKYNPEIVSRSAHKVASRIAQRYLYIGRCLDPAASLNDALTTSPRTTSPPRKQSPILTRSFSAARTSCERITPVNSSPAGRGTPSTTLIEIIACTGDKRVTDPSTTELGDGGWGRTRGTESVYEIVHSI
jgi:hypothetical protein